MTNPRQDDKATQGMDDAARRAGERAAEQTTRIGQAAADQTARVGQAAARKCFRAKPAWTLRWKTSGLAPFLCLWRFQANAVVATATSSIADMTTPVAV